LKDAQGQYKGIADQQARINQANQTAASGFGELQGSLNSLVGRRKEQEDLMAQSRAAEEAAHAEALEKYKAKQAQRTQTPTYENSSGSGRGRTVVK
jgi:peptidoglycan hydrolase CwlO-like protein